MCPGSKWIMPKASIGINRTIYFYSGKVLLIENQKVRSNHSAEIKEDFDVLIENGEEQACILLLQGRPIAEPVVQYGPFVMNTKEEIKQAYQDYNETQFGTWPWLVSDPVHAANKGRFALYADGTEEEKNEVI